MARYKPQRQARYTILRLEDFTPLEARELSILPKRTPALQAMRIERQERRARFERLAAGKIERGRWRRTDIEKKWKANLVRLYSKMGWRVKQGATGRQRKMPKGSPNPWSMYRAYTKRFLGKNYVSPWEVKQIKTGTTPLDKGLLFVQKAAKEKGTVSKSTIREWLEQKAKTIRGARGERKVRLRLEYDRLERLL